MFDVASTPALETIRLAGLRLSPAEQRLYASDGAPLALERKAFELLCFLVAQRARVVGKDELLQAVWGRSVASDSVIAQAVSKARKALAQGGGDVEWIDVARGVGYRYVGPAETILAVDGGAVAASATQPPGPAPAARRWRAAALLLLVAVAGVAGGTWWQREAALRDPLRIAVLPWRDDSGDAALEWVALGLQGLLVDALASDRRIAPLPQGSVRALLAARPDLVDAAAQADYLVAATGATHVYAGRLARDGDELVAELIALGGADAASARVAGRDAAALAVAAAGSVTQRLLPGFDPASPPPLSTVAFANEAYARGVDARVRGRAEQAARHLQSAIDADPGLLAARYQLSLAQQAMRDNDAWKATLDELLALAGVRGDRLHEGLALNGLGVHAWREARYADAEALIRDSLRRFDGPADALRTAAGIANLGSLAAIQGRFDEAEREMSRALVVFEDAGQRAEVARVSKNLGVMNVDRGRFTEGRALFERSLALRQQLGLQRELADTLVSIGAADLAAESPAAAEASLARAAAIFAEYRDPLLESDALARLALAQIAQGQLAAGAASAGRSLAAARTAENAAARGLALLRLALVARLRGDLPGARAELDRAEQAMREADDAKGLLRVALDRIALDPAAADSREPLAAALDQARATGWRVLEAEALSLRAAATPGAPARADHAAALTIAREVGEPALLTELACRYAAYDVDPDDAMQQDATRHCLAAAARHPDAALLRARTARAAGDLAGAREWLERRRSLLGEAWSATDQRELDALATGAEPRPPGPA